MSEQITNNLALVEKIYKLQNSISTKQQCQLIEDIVSEGNSGEELLLDLLIDRRIINKLKVDYLDGFLFKVLNRTGFDSIKKKLDSYFKNGIIELNTSLTIDYQALQNLLAYQKFQEADRLTQVQLCQLAGIGEKKQRDWLYFTDIALLPSEDLYVIDLLWRIYSGGKFGFSIQRQIWLANNCNWEKLWHKIGWKNEGISYRYPDEFIWNTNAPYGHLPLFNQLRGVQVLHALFQHIIWSQSV
uniref:GUN4-like domain-containing protein n=1 Tax=Sebdenia flabellata TaxID=42024 RepID=A0A1C9CA16_9FLOR|nr:hypothetical protein Sebd_122 [Sebdenia flabellata]AOM65209.1 hypothetical protein Sebd_122 [Sebdenia flabellata]